MAHSLARPARLAGLVICALYASLATPAEAGKDHPPCSANPNFTVVDFSMPVTYVRAGEDDGLDALKKFGIKTVIRYYDHKKETIACKTLLPDEADAILAKGFSIAVVFQHNNGDPETFFNTKRGKEDARRSLELAAANGQPYGSTIYFGVDGADQVIKDMVYEYGISGGKPMTKSRRDALIEADKARHVRFYARFLQYKDTHFMGVPVRKLRPKDMLPFIRSYFVDVNAVFAEAAASTPGKKGYNVGGYGSGLVCEFLLENALVKYCWLAQSDGWPGFAEFAKSKKWSLMQEKDTACPHWRFARGKDKRVVKFDINTPNAGNPDFGQWSKKRANVTPIARPTTCPGL
jgi:hypothetical protein